MKTGSWLESLEKISGAGIGSKLHAFKNKELESKYSLYCFNSKKKLNIFLCIFISVFNIFLESQEEDFFRLFGPYMNPNHPNRKIHPVWHGNLWQNFDPNNTQHQARLKQGDEWVTLQANLKLAALAVPIIFNLFMFLIMLFTKLSEKHPLVFFAPFWFLNIFGPIFSYCTLMATLSYTNLNIVSIILIWYSSFNSGFSFRRSFYLQSIFFFLHCVIGSFIFSSLSVNTSIDVVKRLQIIISHLTPFTVGLYALRTMDLVQRKKFVLQLTAGEKKAEGAGLFSSSDKKIEEEYNHFFNKAYTSSFRRYLFIVLVMAIVNGSTFLDAPAWMRQSLITLNFGLMAVIFIFILLSFNKSYLQKNLQNIGSLAFLMIGICQIAIFTYLFSKLGTDIVQFDRAYKFIQYSIGAQGVVRILQHGSSSFPLRLRSYVGISIFLIFTQLIAAYVVYGYYFGISTSLSTITSQFSRTFLSTTITFVAYSICTFIYGTLLVMSKETNTRAISGKY